MISVKDMLQLKSDRTFVVHLMADEKPKKFRLCIEPVEVAGETIERIVCEEGLTRLLHARPQAAQSFFRMVGNLYHGKKIEFPVDLV